MNFFSKNIEEIQFSFPLRVYGFFLSFIHVLTFLYWHGRTWFVLSSDNPLPICWSFYESCGEHRLPIHTVGVILWLYLLVSIGVCLLFLFPRTLKVAYWMSIPLWIFKWLVMVQDFRLMGNYHYMPFVLAFVFLFLPRKLDLSRLLIVGFYISAASLKLSPEWMTGSALYGQPLLDGKLLELSCIYVIFLEFFVSLGLLARNKWFFYAAFSQFLGFHIFSWHIVGFFYPTVMFCVLSIFVLARLFGDEESLLERLQSFRLPKSVYGFLAIYVFFQIIPLFFPGDTALTGEGRTFALNMFDSRADCHALILSRFKNLQRDDSFLIPKTGARIQCDPILFMDLGRTLCQRYHQDPNFIGLDVDLYSKRTSELVYHHIVNLPDFCTKDIHYDLFKHNTWIAWDNNR